jgi:glutathione S-transferase
VHIGTPVRTHARATAQVTDSAAIMEYLFATYAAPSTSPA